MSDDLTPTSPGPVSPAPEPLAAPGPASTPGRPPVRTAMPEYRGEELDAERGPGLGCFWFQVALLVFFIILAPLSVELGWPPEVSAVLLFVVIGLLLFVGQTVIFLLRIVAAERRGRRRPLASGSRTVGEIEDAVGPPGDASEPAQAALPPAPTETAALPSLPDDPGPPDADGGVRQ